MKIHFLGSGSAFVLAHENYHSNMLISDTKGNSLLFDAGTSISEALYYNNKSPLDIQNIFISHLHADHCGGLEYIAFKQRFSTTPFGKTKPNLYGKATLLTTLWENTLKGTMGILEGHNQKLNNYFNVQAILTPSIFHIGSLICEIVPVKHIVDSDDYSLSFGLYITDSVTSHSMFISGDCQFDTKLMEWYEKSDVIFQDCEFKHYDNSVHAQFRQLMTLPSHIKSKMCLYHYIEEGNDFYPMVKREGFKDLVRRGNIYTTSN